MLLTSFVTFATLFSLLADDKLPSADPELAGREQEYYRIEDIPIPKGIVLEAGSLLALDDGRLIVGTRRGEIYFVTGALEDSPRPTFHRFAEGLQEILGLAWANDTLTITQQSEVTRVIDKDGDGLADRFETVSDAWGFGAEHEYTFGSNYDREGNIWVACCLSGSYTSDHPFRGWAFKITPDGQSIPSCSGIRSPGGVGMNAQGQMFYIESQGPWNGANSLKPLIPGGFMGHPISFTWYDQAPNMGPRPLEPKGGPDSRLVDERARIPELVAPAVVFPYRRMGQSLTAFAVDRSDGAFGPYQNQMFIGDYTLSLVMRITTEKIKGVDQGACYPFAQGFRTGIIGLTHAKNGTIVVGGCSRGWPARSPDSFALQRIRWTGKTPFEIHELTIEPKGFRIVFTEPVDPGVAQDPANYEVSTFTHHYWGAYGSKEIDHTYPTVTAASLLSDGRTVLIEIDSLQRGHIHQLSLPNMKSQSGVSILHDTVFYTVNEIPGS